MDVDVGVGIGDAGPAAFRPERPGEMIPAAPVRWGIIGAGWFASRRHIPDIVAHPEAHLAALCRRDPAALERLREHFQPEAVFADWREMLDRCPPDAVLVATPHHLHYEPARAALERGLHVLVEKPMTLDPNQAWELCSLAEERGLQLGVALNPPFRAHCHRIRAALQDGSLGDLEAVTMAITVDASHVFGEAPPPEGLPGVVPPTLFRADPEECGGGFLADSGAHLISELLWVTGSGVSAVTCLMDSLPSDRRAAMALSLSCGATATISCTGNSRHPARRLRKVYFGSRGTARVEGFDFTTTLEAEGEPETCRERELPPVPSPVGNLIDAVRGRATLLSPGKHGARVTEVLSAAYASAREGRAVVLNR